MLFSWYSSKAMKVNLLHEMPRLCRRLLAYADVVPLQSMLEINLRCQSQTSPLERHGCAMMRDHQNLKEGGRSLNYERDQINFGLLRCNLSHVTSPVQSHVS